jgi:hypothetical protein
VGEHYVDAETWHVETPVHEGSWCPEWQSPFDGEGAAAVDGLP